MPYNIVNVVQTAKLMQLCKTILWGTGQTLAATSFLLNAAATGIMPYHTFGLPSLYYARDGYHALPYLWPALPVSCP